MLFGPRTKKVLRWLAVGALLLVPGGIPVLVAGIFWRFWRSRVLTTAPGPGRVSNMGTISTITLPAGTLVVYVKAGVRVTETVGARMDVELVAFTDDPNTSLVRWAAAPGGEAFATEPS